MILNHRRVRGWIAFIRISALGISALILPHDRWYSLLGLIWLAFAFYAAFALLPLFTSKENFVSVEVGIATDAALAALLVYATGGLTSPCIFIIYLPVMEAAIGVSFPYAVLMTLWTIGWLGYLGSMFGFPEFKHLTQFQRSYAFSSTAVCLAAAFSALYRLSLQREIEVHSLRTEKATLEDLADRDPLTGAWNRRAFDRIFEEHLDLARDTGDALTLILIDVDNMKEINDFRGHEAGDVALMTLVDHLRHNCREGDLVFRYGGDEFALLLPASNTEVATGWIERVREHLRETQPRFSVGWSTYPETAADVTGLMRVADTVLYAEKSKRTGLSHRNPDPGRKYFGMS